MVAVVLTSTTMTMTTTTTLMITINKLSEKLFHMMNKFQTTYCNNYYYKISLKARE